MGRLASDASIVSVEWEAPERLSTVNVASVPCSSGGCHSLAATCGQPGGVGAARRPPLYVVAVCLNRIGVEHSSATDLAEELVFEYASDDGVDLKGNS